ncbi:TIM barrel protein [Paraclostridium ghonii]|uniref:sugar phosphate isomerase/epimerase family protein n=1 Tax=Paraclostridium ghonii TaxID=29358 RepID=UPI00202CEB64|nr:TIM barrel protein [Paeniclostridium ghonii]MCM0165769.1 sugar phosphate isomerase/epimerase [Paeniclostridium ghonii]
MKLGIPALVHEIESAIYICKTFKQINHIEIGIDNLYECEQILNYKNEFKENDISVGIHLPMELNTCENVEYVRSSWIKFIYEINNKLNVLDIKYFNMHLGYVIKPRYDKDKIKYLNNSINFLQSINVGKSNIFIENTYTHGGDISNIGTTASEFEYIFKYIDNIGFCYDTGHDLINKDNFIDILKDKVNLIHLSDNDGNKDLHIGIGKGILNLGSLKNLMSMNIQYAVLEIKYEDIDESIKVLERFM